MNQFRGFSAFDRIGASYIIFEKKKSLYIYKYIYLIARNNEAGDATMTAYTCTNSSFPRRKLAFQINDGSPVLLYVVNRTHGIKSGPTER